MKLFISYAFLRVARSLTFNAARRRSHARGPGASATVPGLINYHALIGRRRRHRTNERANDGCCALAESESGVVPSVPPPLYRRDVRMRSSGSQCRRPTVVAAPTGGLPVDGLRAVQVGVRRRARDPRVSNVRVLPRRQQHVLQSCERSCGEVGRGR